MSKRKLLPTDKRALVAVALVAVVLVLSFSKYEQAKCGSLSSRKICIETVKSDRDRQIGMSKYSSYSCGRGMLFDFGEPGYYSIWMKNMKFSLDIAWLDADKKVVKVERNVSPETFPKSFTSESPASYVLETFPGCYGQSAGDILTL